MIVTVTPNPSLDRTFDVLELEVGEVNRAVRTHVHAGGKGINVSRAIAEHGVRTRAVLPVGDTDGAVLVKLLRELGVATRAVPVRGTTRSNVAVVDAGGVTTKVNAAGPTLSGAEVVALVAAVEDELDAIAHGDGGWLVLAGSVPTGAEELYVRLLEAAARRSVPVAVDASGAALARVVDAGGTALLKPNLEELWGVLSEEPRAVGEIVEGARQVLARGHETVLVSLGADGALLVTRSASWWAGGLPLVPRSTVGAGDSALAGFLVADVDPASRLRTAVAWGRAATSLPGSAAPAPHDIRADEVRVVSEPDPGLLPAELVASSAPTDIH